MGRATVLIADDHMMIVEAFRKLLEPGFEVVGVALDGRELLRLAQETKPDVVLLDLGMIDLNGFDAGQQLKKLLPATKIVVVTMSDDAYTADAALREWASGYLTKTSARPELLKAISEVMDGRRYLSRYVAAKQLECFVRNPGRPEPRPLTPRQREVLQVLASGHSMKEAAEELHLTSRTIAFHKYSIMREYGLRNNFDLLRFAFKQEIAPLA